MEVLMVRLVLPLVLVFAGCSGDEGAGKYSTPTDPSVTRPIDTEVDSEDTTTTDTVDTQDSDTAVTKSDFELLGGDAAIDAVLDAFLGRVAADGQINWMFANADLAALKSSLHDQISQATGGPGVYTGPDMATAHAGMAITDAQFGALVGDLLGAFDDLGVDYTPGTFDGDKPADRLIVALAGMQGDIVTDAAGDKVLFNQLGGYAAVNAVVTSFIGHVAADANINWMFANTDIARLNMLLVEQICAATGGYCTYSGGDMKTVHAGMNITNAQFQALVGDLLLALDDHGVAYTLPDFSGGKPADMLILALAGMQADIVTDPDGSTVLFNQLGGHGAITAVVDQFVTNVGADANINWMFANTDLVNLKALLTEQICQATGGYCVYSGRDMVTVHAGMAITDAQFGDLVGDLLASFDTFSVPYSPAFDQNLPGDQVILALASMQTSIVTDPAGDQVLFNQLGGHAAITTVVGDFLGYVAADSVINARFASTDIARLQSLLIEQICEATGGYCVYSGKDMLTAHTGMAITDSEFDAMVGDLLLSLDDNGVAYTANTYNGGLPADSLITALAGMRGDIVGH